MKYKRLVDLTDDEVREIVTVLVSPKEISKISRNSKYDEISCQIVTDWEDDGEKFDIEDTLILQNPFETDDYPINVDFSLTKDDYWNFVKFCFAKRIVSRMWVKDNKWLEVEE